MKRKILRLSVLGILLSAGGCTNFSSLSGVDKLRISRDVVYTPASWPAPLLADVYDTRGTSPAPAVLLIHGGGWKAEGPRWTMDWIARKLSKRGYVVVNATYRGLPEDRYPAPVDDLKEAVRWMRRNSGVYGIDPERIATFGYSAGGHLAAMVALDDANSTMRIKAIVAGGAPFDLSLYPGGDIVPAFLGGTRNEVPDLFKQASPLNHVQRESPPIFIYHGTKDKLVPPEHAERMMAAYHRIGRNTEIHWLEGKSHISGFIFSGKAIDRSIDFLDQTLKQ